ncbi:hypothetical protein ZIOFF_040861 [Zingiber officinale]|uniref:Transmembrane protein n=2 Tax=Zingiber officinale TaxID=94328 RepID=A0A8J5L1C4_ZINOF|nr:hypothetical protein ZIOFF_040861 [Zingiber officinale]
MMLLELNLSDHHHHEEEEEEEEEEDKKLVASQEQSSSTSISSVEIVVAEWDGRSGSTADASLLRALQLSQTRAREAEKKAAAESDRSHELSRLLMDDALRLSAYRRWATLLEAENSMLRLKGLTTRRPQEEEEEGQEEDEREEAKAKAKAKKKATPAPMAGWVALASCVGIAGVGFVVARNVHYSIQQQENDDRVKPRLTVRLGFLQIHVGAVHFDGVRISFRFQSIFDKLRLKF